MSDINKFYTTMQCMKKDANLMGDSQSSKAKRLVVRFEMCVDDPDTAQNDKKCKEESVIKDWLQRKFIIMLENKISFEYETVQD